MILVQMLQVRLKNKMLQYLFKYLFILQWKYKHSDKYNFQY